MLDGGGAEADDAMDVVAEPRLSPALTVEASDSADAPQLAAGDDDDAGQEMAVDDGASTDGLHGDADPDLVEADDLSEHPELAAALQSLAAAERRSQDDHSEADLVTLKDADDGASHLCPTREPMASDASRSARI